MHLASGSMKQCKKLSRQILFRSVLIQYKAITVPMLATTQCFFSNLESGYEGLEVIAVPHLGDNALSDSTSSFSILQVGTKPRAIDKLIFYFTSGYEALSNRQALLPFCVWATKPGAIAKLLYEHLLTRAAKPRAIAKLLFPCVNTGDLEAL